MNKSSVRGAFLLIAIFSSILLIADPPDASADDIDIKIISVDKTTIIELINNSAGDDISTFEIWLGDNFNFKSFKTEKGWVGEKTLQNRIVFTSSELIKPGQSVKFGIKTDRGSPEINWEALDKNDRQLGEHTVSSDTTPSETPIKVPDDTKDTDTQQPPITPPETPKTGITGDSIFKIVPKNPNVGSSIRVIGDSFGASQKFEFYINSERLGSFQTNENGYFMTTITIPQKQSAERVDFKIKDMYDNETKMSLRLGIIKDKPVEIVNTAVTVKGIPNAVHRGDYLNIFGTAPPDTAVTLDVTNPEKELINTRAVKVDGSGNWRLEEPIIISLDAPLEQYDILVSDGKSEVFKATTVKSNKVIIIAPQKLRVDPGETMKFNGVALSNKPIDLVLEDPLGKVIDSDIREVGSSGSVTFEFPTDQNTVKGTYTLIATQDNHKEFIFVGVGVLPTIPVNLSFDKLNYKTSETAIISLTGKASDIVSLLIIDPSDKPKGDTISITLQQDGRGVHSIDLEGYSSGIYTAVLKKGTAQTEEIFTVGLQTGSGEIKINTTKTDYLPGDSFLVLGDTGKNVLLTLTLTNPDGKDIKIKETFSDKDGKISEDSLKIPSSGKPGMWKLKATSGKNFHTIEFTVLETLQEGLTVSVVASDDINQSKTITIHVKGAKQKVLIDIVNDEGETIKNLKFVATNKGEVSLPWIIPKDIEPGTYTFKVEDAVDTAETTFYIQ